MIAIAIASGTPTPRPMPRLRLRTRWDFSAKIDLVHERKTRDDDTHSDSNPAEWQEQQDKPLGGRRERLEKPESHLGHPRRAEGNDDVFINQKNKIRTWKQ